MRHRLVMSLRLLLFGCVGVWLSAPLLGQAVAADAGGQTASQTAPQTVLKLSVRTVVLDVVVTGKDGRPVEGLRAENFTLAEDGRAQTLTHFEEHSGRQAEAMKPGPAVELPSKELPPNTFTNIPQVPPTNSLTVLLLDSLNTPQEDQRFVKAQILEFLKKVQPGRRMAIFTLGSQLRFVQGFSDDPAALKAALNDPRLGTNPQGSPLLQSDQEKNANQQTLANMQQYNAASAAALGNFLNEQTVEQAGMRTMLTLTAFQNLGHYLAGFGGRKNILWFSGAFPLTLFPSSESSIDTQRFNNEAVKQTDALLSSAQVAVYPIGAEGVRTSVIFDAEHQLRGASNAQAARQQIASDAQAESMNRNAAEAAMDQIAHDTGGIAIKETNGLADAIDRVVEHGSAYYTMSFTPANAVNDGRFRKIQVKLTRDARSKGAHLAYRQGYYAADAKASQNLVASSAGANPLRPLMDLGMPASTEVPLVVQVQRGKRSSTLAGGNAALQGTAGQRYAVTFLLKAKDLQFRENADGSEHDRVQATLLAYSQEGRPLNWMVREVNLDMDAARFVKVQGTGIHFDLEIDAPQEAIALRAGVYDLNAGKAGTLEVAVDHISPGTAAAHGGPDPVATNGEPLPALKLAENVSTRETEGAGLGTGQPPALIPVVPRPVGSVADAEPDAKPGTAPKAAPEGRTIAFWSQPAERIDPVLLHVPLDNVSRYARLRQDFQALHCTKEEMEEQPVTQLVTHKERKNLICTLAGKDTKEPVIVAARYDRGSGSWGANQRWGEGLMLPLLFNALRAEPRQHTFVFVALDGEAGERTFFEEFGKRSAQVPSAVVVLDALGLGAPTIYTSYEAGLSKRSRRTADVNRMLASAAMISAGAFRLPSPVYRGAGSMAQGLMQPAFYAGGNWILEREADVPSILIHSAPESLASSGPALSADAFHKDFNFIAYLLCGIDGRLALSDEPAVSMPGRVSSENR